MKRRIKLIYVMQEFSTDVGGWAMHQFLELSKFIDITVLAQPYKHSIKEAKEIEIINPHFKILRYKGYELRGTIYPTDLKSLLAIEKEITYSTLILQMDEFFKFYTIQAAKWCKENNVPYIISSRMRPRPGRIRNAIIKIFAGMAKEAVLNAKKIIATQGKISQDEFMRWFPIKQESDFAIIPSGIDIQRFKGQQKIKKDKKDIILAVSRVYRIKRIDLMLKVFSKVLKNRNNVELWIVGKSDKKEWNRLINNFNFRNVKYFGGLDNKELPKIYSQAKIFVNTSETEGICFAFLEAMAFKLPIITWDVGGNSGVVENWKTGALFSFGNIPAMAFAIIGLLDKADSIREFGDNAYIKLQNEFDIKKNVQKLLKVYGGIIK